MVISDVFAGPQTPPHLTTVECAQAAARALRPGGTYAVNVADGPPLGYAKEQASTIGAVFPSCCLIAEPAVLRRRRYGDLVLAGSRRGFPEDDLARRAAADPFPARLVCGADLTRFAARRAPPPTPPRGPPPPRRVRRSTRRPAPAHPDAARWPARRNRSAPGRRRNRSALARPAESQRAGRPGGIAARQPARRNGGICPFCQRPGLVFR